MTNPATSPDSGLAVVTGGAGFIGSHLVEALLAKGRRVRVVDDFSTGHRRNLPGPVELLCGNVSDLAEGAVVGADVVYHLAAQVSVPRSVEDPMGSHRATESSTLAVLHAAERAGVRRVVIASSSAVYGDRPAMPKKEAQEPAPTSPYAVAKLCSEIHARHWAEYRGLQTVCLRFFNVYGPRQDPRSPYAAAIPIFISNLMAEQPVPVFGDGKQTRDFTYVEDVVQGILSAGSTVGASGRVYNIASGRGTSVLELIETLAQLMGVRAQLELLPPRAGDIKHSRADITAAARDLKFASQTGLKHGLMRTVEWFKTLTLPARRSA
ncbi:MAG TPA: NAD-dependent epimerase/dehydratase family protein [Planctomycetota bacterium]|nr:NAD-dependent epimerase/dehydratase family protein [Planctomycetota bacterium]